ncbi:DUF2126 domain-containing protein [Rhodovulum sp. DZ06]|uniref:transglutaminase family protein n=1 Tax=Rhodovulum sp. DZ06 TaxID=3425126 RepID=UPI003D356A59
MAISVALTHRTTYRYDRHIKLWPHIVRLRPAPHARTPIESYSLNIDVGDDHFINWQQDPFSNWMARLVFPEKVDHLEITVDLIARMDAINPFDFFLEEDWQELPAKYAEDDLHDLAPYLRKPQMTPRFTQFVKDAPQPGGSAIDWLVAINQYVERAIGYNIRMEPGVQTPEETLVKATGSCRDSGWLLVNMLRHYGYAARFVSGYLIQLTADLAPIDGGAAGPTEDFTDLHAWTEVYMPGAGWIGLDPTSGLFAGEGHIPLACTPEPRTAAPVSGAHEKLEPEELHFGHFMEVTRLREPPRVTKPLTDMQWRSIDSAGKAIDARMRQSGLNLTMGGEPTFVSAYDRDAPEWTTDAVGPTKRSYADRLIRKFRDHFAPDGMLHYGQGKWYPGEQLPRWAFSLYWRTDGIPMWSNPDLIASVPEEGAPPPPADDARRFMERLCENLDLPSDAGQPAWEDGAAFVLRESQLPLNVDPEDSKLEEPEERARLAKVFGRGLTTPSAYVLPIQLAQASDGRIRKRPRRRFRWWSEKWATRRGKLMLVPGDSPAGFRLPLGSLTWLPEDERQVQTQRDPFDMSDDMPTPRRMQRRVRRKVIKGGKEVWEEAAATGPEGADYVAGPAGDSPFGYVWGYGANGTPGWIPLDMSIEDVMAAGAEPGAVEYDEIDVIDEHGEAQTIRVRKGAQIPTVGVPMGSFLTAPAVRTALTVEPRDGALCVFLPPTGSGAEYADLLNAIEETAEELGMPVHVEGYPPPSDWRMNKIMVTPDPGVIEINIHPSHSWDEHVRITEAVYEEARQLGLDASSFQLDGKPTGSGGGNHIVVGGATPDQSPFLNRPDMLASIIRYWNNHPSLSYFFNGLFIGPTSQAPRTDESRADLVEELEIALNQMPPRGAYTPPWLVDRLFRNLLCDVTGNTHRTEICIDKMFSPDGPAGRLGLVEFRAFEMPPHPRMSSAQALIIRALLTWFWEEPCGLPLKRWGPELHDKFLLPHFCWQDFCNVLSELSTALGVHFDPAWFAAQHEFRFPLAGRASVEGVEIELRTALEPWLVLGEEGSSSGTVRYVDSSVERVQVKIDQDLPPGAALTVNGIEVPLTHAGGSNWIAGVRFRAWQPPSCLHPTIPPHAPLVFDIVDRENGRSLGGCTYRTYHPGGRAPETRPVNALEAEGRLLARFDPMAHTPGWINMRSPWSHPVGAATLDMRKIPF